MPAQLTQLGNLAGNALRVPNKRHSNAFATRRSCIMASTTPDAANISRRAGLLTTAGGLLVATSGLVVPPALAAEKAYIEVGNLSSFQKAGQRKLMLVRGACLICAHHHSTHLLEPCCDGAEKGAYP